MDIYANRLFHRINRNQPERLVVVCPEASGKEAWLCFGANALMDNHNDLCAEFTVRNPIEQGERAWHWSK